MLHALYTIVIFPIVQIIETIYVLIYRIFENTTISIIGVSFAVTLLSLPLYIVAEKWQKKERDTAGRLKPKLDKIKNVFKGDEQHMIITTFYRQNHYHPIYGMRNSFGILIQIPFFIAAYTFLSNLKTLQGFPFLFIRDMGAPDALVNIGNGMTLNILPVLMTVINCIAGAIYTKGLSGREKIQIYGMAAVFLILLYNSPAGLVLYWTMNNILSLVKNIFYKLRHPLIVLYIVVSGSVLVFVAYLLFIRAGSFNKRLLLAGVSSLVLFIPLYIKFASFLQKRFLSPLINNDYRRTRIFILSCLVLAVLTGFFISTTVIASSPDEFSFIDQYRSPFPFIGNSILQTLGLFVFWPLCIYSLFGRKIKTLLTCLFSSFSLYALLNTLVFQGNYGVISNTFSFSTTAVLTASAGTTIINSAALLAVIAVVFLLVRKDNLSIVSSGLAILLAALAVFSFYNVFRINKAYTNLLARYDEAQGAVHAINPVFSLSKDKRNVIVCMADGAVNGFVKPIFEEHPRLKKQFDGFTLYPNTVSFAVHTLMGVPPIWGGYEYTPEEMNKRDSTPLAEKHNEAMLVLPRLFAGAGYDVTVTDPSWANYAWVPDTRIYDAYENINALNTKGRYTDLWYKRNNFGEGQITGTKIKRNTLWFSFLKIAPPPLRKIIYNDGWYWGTDDIGTSLTDFINSYAVLDFLPDLTAYDAKKPSALFFTNDLTHEVLFLQYPGYVPVESVTARGSGEFSENQYYHTNNAFYLQFGKWLDELKKNNVYDNTRIIIVSDHGAGVDAKLADTDISIPGERREKYNPVLLVKDFGSRGELKTDNAFMSNGDVPVLALKDIIDDPVNPFTGHALKDNPKESGLHITINHLPLPDQHNKNTFKIQRNQWVSVRNNIFDAENWESAAE
ncbi:MAG: membrane protein insertase YidC [Treponema sp.]|jgi:YidC/Oxa1 family membrane protein insertase|nr:membrane protein insertase YidC [Treponema sp.]